VADPRELYDTLTDDLLYDPVVERSTMMGYPCVRRAGQFFASFDTGSSALVVKLPAERVSALIADGTGAPFAPNGRRFREWVSLPRPDVELWEQVLTEAHQFAGLAARATRAAIDELADRIREVLAGAGVTGAREQRMFGGLAFLVGGHMAVAASREGGLLLSVDRTDTAALLRRPHTRPMVMRGKELAGWLRVDEDGIRTKRQLTAWVQRGVAHARQLPPK
jgi:hypothetical protein